MVLPPPESLAQASFWTVKTALQDIGMERGNHDHSIELDWEPDVVFVWPLSIRIKRIGHVVHLSMTHYPISSPPEHSQPSLSGCTG